MRTMSTAKRMRLERRRKRLEEQLERLYGLMESMASGRAQSYTIGSRSITYRTIGEVQDAIDAAESKLEDVEAQLSGHRRCAVAVIPKDW